jgi:hypothetical protein
MIFTATGAKWEAFLISGVFGRWFANQEQSNKSD